MSRARSFLGLPASASLEEALERFEAEASALLPNLIGTESQADSEALKRWLLLVAAVEAIAVGESE